MLKYIDLYEKISKIIQGSLLLSPERKKRLLSLLPTLNEKQVINLKEILLSENDVIQEMIAEGIQAIVEQGDRKKIKQLGDTLQSIQTHTMKKSEDIDRNQETKRLDVIFNDA